MERNSDLKTDADLFDSQESTPRSLAELNRTIAASEPLMPGAGRAVLGEGAEGAAIAFVGEQPGDQEDIQERPFVGPAGQLLNRALEDAGIDRKEVYITNAVKNFKFQMRGTRRIHQKPTAGEVKRYRWWLDKELDLVSPKIVVALGSTAAFALAGRQLSIGRNRGELRLGERKGYITVHPSYLLRIPDAAAKKEAYREFRRSPPHPQDCRPGLTDAIARHRGGLYEAGISGGWATWRSRSTAFRIATR
jgi:uracil-DNA glycosylase family protein